MVAADEFAENVDDNAFTNAVAKEALLNYNKAARRLGLHENPHFEEIATKIAFYKLENNVTSEYRNYDGRTIKQADVNLLAFPLKTITDPNQIRRDLEYYKERIGSGTPAMTEAIFTILYCRLGDPDKAYDSFINSFRLNVWGPFEGFTESKLGMTPYFITGAGGVLQSVIYGFGGIDITDEGITQLPPVLPKQWKSITIKGFTS